MKTPGKTSKKQNPNETHGSKAQAIDKNKNTGGPWKDPDPTDPRKSPEKINEPYARTNAATTGTTKTTTKQKSIGTKNERITNAGESEHHIPVNKSDYENFQDEYEDFKLEEEEEDLYDEDEEGETSTGYEYEDEEDESKQFRSQVKTVNQKNSDQTKLNQNKPGLNKTIENKNKSQLPANSNQKKNKNPQA